MKMNPKRFSSLFRPVSLALCFLLVPAFAGEAAANGEVPNEEISAAGSAGPDDTAEAVEAPSGGEAARHRAIYDWPEDPSVFLIRIEGPIMRPMQYVYRRAVRRALDEDAAAIVLIMNTPGGSLEVTRDMVNMIIDLDIPTYTFVEEDAISGGAILALATDHIFMAPQSRIGDAMVMMMGPGGFVELDDAAREKIESPTDALVRNIAHAKGRDEMLLRSMVRRELEYVLEDGTMVSPAGNVLTLTYFEAERLKPNGEPLLSDGTKADLDEMLAFIGLGDATRLEEELTWADQLASAIATVSPILVLLAFMLFYIEINTPGIGWAGGLALLLFLLLLFSQNIAGLAGREDLVLIALGVVLIMVEVLLIPGFGVVGFAGVVVFMWGLVQAFIIRYPGNPGDIPGFVNFGNVGPAVMTVSLAFIVSVAFLALFIACLDRNPFAKKHLILQSTLVRDEATEALTTLLGKPGVALSALGPSGSAEIDGREMSVVTNGEYVEPGAPVTVTDVHGNRVVVRPREAVEKENA